MKMSFKKCDLVILGLTAVVLASIIVPVTADSGSYGFVTAWGSYGTGDGNLKYPYNVHVDNDTGYIYVADTFNNRVQKFTSSGSYLTQWDSEGTTAGKFYLPSSIAINSSGYIYVLDTGNHRVQVFSSDGVYYDQWGSEGSGDEQFDSPDCIAVNLTSGHVYVSDTFNNRIQKFSADGTNPTSWGSVGTSAGQFDFPEGIKVDQTTGNVYVVDSGNDRVQKFTSDGSYLTTIGSTGEGNGQFLKPYAIGIDNNGNIYVSDTQRNDIQKFTSGGTYVTKWGEYGTGNGQFSYVHSISIDNSSTYIYVADGHNHRVQKFQWVPYIPVPPDPDGGGGSSTSIAAGSNIKAGESVVLNLKKGSNTALTEIVVTVNDYVNSILVTADKIKAGKFTVEPCEGETYQYIKVNSYHVSNDEIDQVILEFTVPKSWFDENDFGLGDIAMMHYNEDDEEWQQLPTEFVREEGGIVYYSAVSPSLSYFAISYAEGAIVIAEETPVTQVPTVKKTIAPTAVPTYVPKVIPTAVPTEAQTAPGFTAFGVLAGLAVAFIVLKRR